MRCSQIVVVLLAAFTTAASAATIRVDWSGGGDFATIQEGIDAAAEGDSVLVAPGTYTGPLNRELDFDTKNIALVSEAGQLQTFIDCDGEGRGFYLSGGIDLRALIRGFTVTNGQADFGGAMWCYSSSPAIVECVFENCDAIQGGAIYVGDFCQMKIVDCTFRNNTATDYGGAMYCTKCFPSIKNCDFDGNEAGINGGAMSLKDGTATTVSSCVFTDNRAPDGGAVFATMTDSLDVGGGYPDFPKTVYKNCKFYENTATRGGGIFCGGFSTVNVTFCTFARNVAEKGGGMYCLTSYTGAPSVVNCTFCRNSALSGSGIYNSASVAYNHTTITNTIIAFGVGGGPAITREASSAIETIRCVTYSNDGGDDLWGPDVLVADPLFCDVYSSDYNFMLCSNSVCLKANNPWDYFIGAHYQGCGACLAPVDDLSWGQIKAMYR